MGNRVGAATSTLLLHPTRRNPQPVSEFLGGQDFEEGTLRRGVLCSELCSSIFHVFSINSFHCMAVR